MSGGHGSYSRFGKNDDENEENLIRNEGEKSRQYQAAILAALASTAAGTSDGWLLTYYMKHKQYQMNLENIALFTNIMNFSAIVGALLCGYLLEKIGRKHVLILAGFLTLPTWILYMISHKILISLSIGTALGGIASGAVSVAVPVYIAEISEISVRGKLGIFFYLQFIAGELFTTIEGKDINLTTIATICIMVATIFLVTFVWMPESPYSSLAKGEENEAKSSVKFFRGSNYSPEDEIENLKQSLSKRTTIKEALEEKNTANAIILSLLLMLLTRLIATDGFNFRVYKIITVIHLNAPDKLATIILLLQIAGIGASAFFIERWGRRTLLIISTTIMTVCILGGLIISLLENHFYMVSELLIFAYIVGFSFGAGPIPWVLMNELVPLQHKVLSSTLAATLFWFISFTSSKRFNLILNLIGAQGLFIFCLIICIAIILITVFLLPETKGKNTNNLAIPNITNFILRKNNTNNVQVI